MSVSSSIQHIEKYKLSLSQIIFQGTNNYCSSVTDIFFGTIGYFEVSFIGPIAAKK